MSELEPNTRVQIEKGATLAVLYTRTGDEFEFAGPALIEFRTDVPAAISGAAPRRRASTLGKVADIRIRPGATTQAAFVMRSLIPVEPVGLLTLRDTQIMELQPEFRWREPESGLTYRLTLAEDGGKVLHEADVRAAGYKLPAAVTLRRGSPYVWEVMARAADGRRFTGSGRFMIAGEEVRQHAEKLRPPAGATVSQRVAYAAWLDHVALHDEARRYWQALAAERPDDARLKALATQ